MSNEFKKIDSNTATRLRSLVEKIERLEAEKKNLTADIQDIYLEAKSVGFDVKVIRQIIKLRKQEPQEIEEQEILLGIYRQALGMVNSKAESSQAKVSDVNF